MDHIDAPHIATGPVTAHNSELLAAYGIDDGDPFPIDLSGLELCSLVLAPHSAFVVNVNTRLTKPQDQIMMAV